MAPEIVRKLIGGQWRTVPENVSPNGGSQTAIKAVYAFDTPDFVAGIPIYTAIGGEWIIQSIAWAAEFITFDGTNTVILIGVDGDYDTLANYLGPIGAGGTNVAGPNGSYVPSFSNLNSYTVVLAAGNVVSIALASNGVYGDDPGCSQGSGMVVLRLSF